MKKHETGPNSDYRGQYRVAGTPKPSSKHNAITWTRLEALIATRGGKADFDALTAAAKGHLHRGEDPTNPHRFVIYCIQRGWLESVG